VSRVFLLLSAYLSCLDQAGMFCSVQNRVGVLRAVDTGPLQGDARPRVDQELGRCPAEGKDQGPALPRALVDVEENADTRTGVNRRIPISPPAVHALRARSRSKRGKMCRYIS
jgi:hypothetical protein